MTPFAIAPALPLHAAGKYVAGAYIVFVVVILIYVAIMALRLSRMERQLVELNHDLALRDEAGEAGEHQRQARHPDDPDGGREPARAGRSAGDSSL
jgi:flagellar biosynthesis/type III secretory pathway M-ring protein FliF/YscJ